MRLVTPQITNVNMISDTSLPFGHISEPRYPALHGKAVLTADVLLVRVERKSEHGERHQKQWNENQCLDKSVFRYSLRPVAIFCSNPQCQQSH